MMVTHPGQAHVMRLQAITIRKCQILKLVQHVASAVAASKSLGTNAVEYMPCSLRMTLLAAQLWSGPSWHIAGTAQQKCP